MVNNGSAGSGNVTEMGDITGADAADQLVRRSDQRRPAPDAPRQRARSISASCCRTCRQDFDKQNRSSTPDIGADEVRKELRLEVWLSEKCRRRPGPPKGIRPGLTRINDTKRILNSERMSARDTWAPAGFTRLGPNSFGALLVCGRYQVLRILSATGLVRRVNHWHALTSLRFAGHATARGQEGPVVRSNWTTSFSRVTACRCGQVPGMDAVGNPLNLPAVAAPSFCNVLTAWAGRSGPHRAQAVRRA